MLGRILVMFVVFCSILLITSSEAKKPPTTTVESEEVIDNDLDELTSTAKTFPRSRFNLRRSTTEATSTTVVPKIKKTRTTTKTTTEAPISTITTVKTPIPCGLQNGEDFPWIVVLEHTAPTKKTGKRTLSKGVLIDECHVLTTVSSIHNSFPYWVVSAVRFGDTPTWAKSDNHSRKNVVSVGIKNVFMHERKDIAIIRLAEPVNITKAISPVCLPPNDTFNYPELYFHVCKKLRNGFTPENRSKLMKVSPLSQQDCQILFRRNNALISHKELCAWDETGDTCTGDLGGPLLAKINGRYHVVGLNSYVQAQKNIDAENLPGVYTRVGSFMKWIEAVIDTSFDFN